MKQTERLRRAHADALAAEGAAWDTFRAAQTALAQAAEALRTARTQRDEAIAARQAAFTAWMGATREPVAVAVA